MERCGETATGLHTKSMHLKHRLIRVRGIIILYYSSEDRKKESLLFASWRMRGDRQ